VDRRPTRRSAYTQRNRLQTVSAPCPPRKGIDSDYAWRYGPSVAKAGEPGASDVLDAMAGVWARDLTKGGADSQ
jgi:hypothetical protein